MVSHPENWIQDFAKAGASSITFHLEASQDPLSLVSVIHSYGMKAGIALKPDTPWTLIEPFLQSLDMVLIMSVEPGFGGQSFMESSLIKISKLRELAGEFLHIQVDGGIGLQNIDKVRTANPSCEFFFWGVRRKGTVQVSDHFILSIYSQGDRGRGQCYCSR